MEASPLVTSGTDGDTNSESFPKKLKVNDDSLRGVPNGEVVQGEADSTDNTENAKPYENGDHKEHKTSCCAAATAEDGNEPSTSSGNRGEPLKAVLDATEAQYIDARTTEQMNDIEAEIKQNLAFISEKEDVSILEEEYEDAIYIQKIADLKTRYRWLRRTRGDGNCFYRSLGLSLFENLMNAKDIPKANAFADLMVKCKDELLEMGYPKFTMEDFVDTFNDNLMRAMEQPSEETLLGIFQDQGQSDFIVVWLRFLTVLQLRKEPDFYENFIDTYPNIVDFCRAEVEPFGKDADNIHVVAITSLLKVKVRIEYMDRGQKVSAHDFPEVEGDPQITLLYRPGHYDVLYRMNHEAQ